MNVRKCPLCGGKPKWVYHSIPMSEDSSLWEPDDEDGSMAPRILYKHIECSSCKAMSGFSITCDGAASAWNEHSPLQFIGEEECRIGD